MSNNKTIPVVIMSEENTIKSLSAAIISLLENAEVSTEYEIYVLNKNQFSTKNINLIIKLQRKYKNHSISFVDIEKTKTNKAKLILNTLTTIDKCIYLSYDVVVQKDLSNLYDIDLKDNYIAGVKGENGINSSVMLINCALIRQDKTKDISEKTMFIELKYNLRADYFIEEKSFNFVKQIRMKSVLKNLYDMDELKCALWDNYIFSYTDGVNPLNNTKVSFSDVWLKYYNLASFENIDNIDTLKVSVIIPVYNVEKYIAECLDSVINQTLDDIEIILIDDGSTDNSYKIMQEYARLDNRIIILQQENQGAGAARNKGLDIAQGEYLSFLDPDDFFELTMLEQTYKKAKATDVDIVVFDFTMYNQSNNKFVPVLRKSPTTKEIFCYKDIPNHIFGGLHHNAWTKLYKTEFVKSKNIRFQHLFRVNDIFFVHTSIVQAKSITYLNKSLVYYRTGTKDNSQATLYKHPLSFYQAELGIYEKLKEIGVYDEVEQSFLNNLLGIAIDNFNRVNAKDGAKIIYNYIKENLDKDFGITKHPKEFYSTQFYNIYMMMRKVSFEYFMELQNSNKPIQKDYNYYKNLSPKFYEEELKEWYKRATGKTLDLKNPKTFNEKIQWLKLYDSTPLKTRLADKYLVRDWIKEKIGEEYLIPLLGVWDSFDEIDFDKLPNQFALKTNHGCGWNYIVEDKSKFNKADAKQKFDLWMKLNFAYFGFELHYMDIKPKIIAEEYIENMNDLYEYKFMCFDGEIGLIWVDSDRFGDHKRTCFDINWNKIDVKVIDYPKLNFDFPKPQNHKKMLKICKNLSKGFACVRIDFYEIDNKLLFGEMTFTSGSGASKIEPIEFGYKLGDMIKLPEKYVFMN